MPTIHIPDDVFADYLIDCDGDASEAKKQMKRAVEDNAPERDP